tara:strand:- start:130 stop:783 length:654 start_codon:yes stop_codon:yes gene_type:complete
MEVTSLKLLEMEKSISIDYLLNSEDFSKDTISKIKKRNFENYADEVDTLKKEFNLDNDDNKADSIIKEKNVIDHNKKVQNQIKKKIKINESDAPNSITIDEIQGNWKNFINKLHLKKPSIASVLDNSIPIKYENGKITIQAATSLDFHLNMIYKNSDLVKNILSDEYKIGLDFIIKNKPASNSDDGQDQDSLDHFNNQDDDQLRDKIVDLFDGEILT